MALPTCHDIITTALQQAKVVALGEEATAEEAGAGLTALQGLYERWMGSGMFGTLEPVYADSSREAEEGQRIFVASEDVEVALPSLVSVCGETRQPYDLAAIEIVNGALRHLWLWDRSKWVDIGNLELSDLAPLGGRGRTGLAACLAMEWVDMFGGELTAGIERLAGAFRTSISTSLGAERPHYAVEESYF